MQTRTHSQLEVATNTGIGLLGSWAITFAALTTLSSRAEIASVGVVGCAVWSFAPNLPRPPAVQSGEPESQAIGSGVVHQQAGRSRRELRDHLVPAGCNRRNGRGDHGDRRCLHALVSGEGLHGSSGFQHPVAGRHSATA
jgi:hypothetical protein